MAKDAYAGPLEQIDSCCWRIPRSSRRDMRVDGLIFASEKLIGAITRDKAPEQVANVANVATLPGIQVASLAMPDIHWGYRFCIGGVCATDPAQGGVISPGRRTRAGSTSSYRIADSPCRWPPPSDCRPATSRS
jgi:tRNA-splicing ligase RtcB (3'-phosphate/5'-hydroxy nucleic acid ligase)